MWMSDYDTDQSELLSSLNKAFTVYSLNEPSRGKTNNVVSEQV